MRRSMDSFILYAKMIEYLYVKMFSLKDISILISSNWTCERQGKHNSKNAFLYSFIFHTICLTILKLTEYLAAQYRSCDALNGIFCVAVFPTCTTACVDRQLQQNHSFIETKRFSATHSQMCLANSLLSFAFT